MKGWMLLGLLPFLLGGGQPAEKSMVGVPVEQPLCVRLAEDCSDGIPRLDCSIWTVTYKGALKLDNIEPEATCQTGGDYKCDPISIAQGLLSFLKNMKPE